MALRKLTVKERILLHLFDFARYLDEYEAPLEVTQTGIATNVGIRVHHVTQYVKPLISEGLLDQQVRHVQQQSRRRKVYFLTPSGRNTVVSLRAGILDQEVPFRRLSGEVAKLTLSQLHQQERRGTRVIELLRELGSSGHVGERPPTMEAGVVDHSQEAPSVGQFHGRQSELDKVIRAVGQVPLIVVSGMAGIGKTAFGAKICEEFRGKRSLLWRRVRPWDTSRSLGLHLAAFLRQAGRPGLHRFLQAGEEDELPRIEEILAVDLSGVDGLLIFDDVHTASGDASVFLELLHGVLRSQRGSSALLLSRTIPGFYSRREVDVEGEVLEVSLAPLDSRTARAILQDAGVSETRAAELARISGGSPLFLRLLARGDSPTKAAGSWNALDAYIAEEIEPSLEGEEVACMQVASFYEVPVPPEGLLLEVGGGLGTVLKLEQRGLLEGAEEGTVLLHDSLRDYFRRGLPKDRREALTQKVVGWLTHEAEEAEGHRKMEAAISLLENAVQIEVLPQRRSASLERLGQARRLSGDYLGASETFRTAWRSVSDDDTKARLHRYIAGCLFGLRQLEETEQEIERGLQLASHDPGPNSAWLLAIRANLAFVRAEFGTARKDLDVVRSWDSQLADDPELAVWTSQLDVLLRSWFPELKEARETREDWRRVFEFASKFSERPSNLWFSLEGLAIATMESGETEEGLALLDRLVELGEKSGRVDLQPLALLIQGWCLLQHLGDAKRAETLFEGSLAMFQEMPFAIRRVPWCYRHFADLYWQQGRFDEARESLAHFLKVTPLPVRGRIENLSHMVRLCVAGGDVDAAGAYLEQAVRLHNNDLPPETLHFLEWAKASVEAARGKVRDAETHFSKALTIDPPVRTGMPGNLIRDLASTHHPGDLLLDFGRFLLSEGRFERAEEVLVRARAEFKRRNRKPGESEAEKLLERIESPLPGGDPQARGS